MLNYLQYGVLGVTVAARRVEIRVFRNKGILEMGSMNAGSPKIIKKRLEVNSRTEWDEKSDQYIFINCRSVQQKSIDIQANITNPDCQIGFFDADCEVYFDQIVLGKNASLSSIVRNYWWNGKEKEEKKEGYYSLIKLVKILIIEEKHVNDLINYVEGRYEVGEHWQIHELNKNIKLRISYGLEKTTIEILSKHFNNIWCWHITDDLKIVNNITYSCERYLFRNNERVVPQKLIINATIVHIGFDDTDNEVYIPEIVMEEKAYFKSIILNYCGKYCSLLPYVQTLVIKNNPRVLCDFADYVKGRYQTYSSRWILHQLNKNMKILIQKPGIAFIVVKEIADHFENVLVDNNKSKEYLAKRYLYQKQFQEHFDRYDLKTDLIGNFILASQEIELRDRLFNIGCSSRRINELCVNQKIEPQQFICFHDTNKPVAIDKIVIEGNGDLRCVLQNAYYSETNAGFFNLLETATNLKIKNNEQAAEDLADYIDGKYTLHPKWGKQALDKDMEVKLRHDKYPFSLDVATRFREYFKNVSIDAISTLLETENVIDQECETEYIFSDCRDTNPQKLVVNAKVIDCQNLILFDDADGEVRIPEITIGEHGGFDAIVRNKWWNCKNGSEEQDGYYSLVSHIETLIIQSNPEAVCDLDKYVSGDYKMQGKKWKVQKLSKNMIVRINGVQGLDEQINRLKDYFGYVVIDGRKALGNQCGESLANIKFCSDKIKQQITSNDDKRKTIVSVCTDIEEIKHRIDQARARLWRRRACFQEYLALAE